MPCPKDCPLCCGAGYIHTHGGEKDPVAGLQDRAECPRGLQRAHEEQLAAAVQRYSNPKPAEAYPGPCDMHEQPAQRSADAARIARAYIAGKGSAGLIDSEKLEVILKHLDAEEGNLQIDRVEDEQGRVFWEMEIDGRWFTGWTAAQCFAKATNEFATTPPQEEKIIGPSPRWDHLRNKLNRRK